MVDRLPTRSAASRQSNTLPERLAILAIVVMAAVVISNYERKTYAERIQQARQAVIREDCKVVSQAADSYRQDKGRGAARSLDDLVQSGYLVALSKGFHKEDCTW
jgi:competence protein ComGC